MTVAGLQVGYLFGCIIVIETLFNYTGMGWLTYQALLNRDIPLIQATVFVIAAVVMLTNLVVDLLYLYFDPRIRLGVGSMKRFLTPKGLIGARADPIGDADGGSWRLSCCRRISPRE